MKRRSIFVIAAFALLMVAGIFYARLGGFNALELEVAEPPQLYFTGVPYYGLATDDSWRERAGELFQAVQEGEVEGDFSVCYLGNPDQDTVAITIWAGVTTLEAPVRPFSEAETWRLPQQRVLRATITANTIVAPNSSKVNDRLREFAERQQLKLDSIYLERYLKPDLTFNEIYIAL